MYASTRPPVPTCRANRRRRRPGRLSGHTALNSFLISGAAYGGLGAATSRTPPLQRTLPDASDPESILSHADLEAMTLHHRHRQAVDPRHRVVPKTSRCPTRTPVFVEHYGTGCGYWNAMRIYPVTVLVAMTNTTFAWDVDILST